MIDDDGRPKRQILPHQSPAWVRPGALHFVTICCQPRGRNQLCHQEVASTIFSAIAYYQKTGKWYLRLGLLMPDHLHALIAFPPDQGMRTVIATWKGFLARNDGIVWERGFFDHRLRDGESLQEKAHYIRQNPVRAGLITKADEWPYVFEADRG